MRGRVREGLVKGVGVKDLQELFTRHGICRRGKGIDRGLARPTSPEPMSLRNTHSPCKVSVYTLKYLLNICCRCVIIIYYCRIYYF